jgi:hypothetical protein
LFQEKSGNPAPLLGVLEVNPMYYLEIQRLRLQHHN